MTTPILCAGRLYCDLVFADAPRLPTLGTEVFAPGLSLHAGGGAFITGATLVGLGHKVGQFSYLPAAPFDSIVKRDLVEFGVDATACKPAKQGIEPQITVAISQAVDRAFLTRADGAAMPDLADVRWHTYSHLHIGELSTLEEHPDLLVQARAAGLTVSLDCGWQDAYDAKAARLISAVDVFLPNESEAAALTAVGVPESCATLTVIKSGKNGARARQMGDRNWIQSAAPSVKVRDATGAGDAFNAGFLSNWLKNAPLAKCLAAGNAHGAAVVQVLGGVTRENHPAPDMEHQAT